MVCAKVRKKNWLRADEFEGSVLFFILNNKVKRGKAIGQMYCPPNLKK